MRFKMRMLHFAKGSGADTIAAAIAKSQEANCDQIPPAYNCENEKLVFVCVDMAKKLDDIVMKFMSNLNPTRIKNIAFVGIGSDISGSMSEIKSLANNAKLNVVGDLAIDVKGGLFKKGKATDADVKKAVDWATKIVDSLAT